MKPSIKKYYQVQELTLYNVITTVIKECRESFSTTHLTNISTINKHFSVMIPNTMRWLKTDFSLLCKPRHDYKHQTTILPRRVEMASAAMVHIGLDPGKLVRWLGGEYIGARREVNHTLAAAEAHVITDDFKHMKRILLDGSPYKLKFNKLLSNKAVMIK